VCECSATPPPNSGLTDADLASLDPRCLGLVRWAEQETPLLPSSGLKLTKTSLRSAGWANPAAVWLPHSQPQFGATG
jgi:hypothetical protein